jgi:hypothetical protein
MLRDYRFVQRPVAGQLRSTGSVASEVPGAGGVGKRSTNRVLN